MEQTIFEKERDLASLNLSDVNSLIEKYESIDFINPDDKGKRNLALAYEIGLQMLLKNSKKFYSRSSELAILGMPLLRKNFKRFEMELTVDFIYKSIASLLLSLDDLLRIQNSLTPRMNEVEIITRVIKDADETGFQSKEECFIEFLKNNKV